MRESEVSLVGNLALAVSPCRERRSASGCVCMSDLAPSLRSSHTDGTVSQTTLQSRINILYVLTYFVWKHAANLSRAFPDFFPNPASCEPNIHLPDTAEPNQLSLFQQDLGVRHFKARRRMAQLCWYHIPGRCLFGMDVERLSHYNLPLRHYKSRFL